MVVITVTVGCKERTNSWTRIRRHDNTEVCEKIHIKEIDLDTVTINIEECDYWCECKNSNSDRTCKNTGSLAKIEILVDRSYDDGDKIKTNLDKIALLIENNKYVQIQNVLNDQHTPSYHEKYNMIKDIINDDTDYSDPDVSFEENKEESSDDNNGITNTYPFAVSFKERNGTYIAKMHIYEYLLDDIYITVKNDTDRGGCYCCSGSYDYEVPVQLIAIRPKKGDDNFSDYDNVWCYSKKRDKYEFDSHLSF